MVLKHLASLKQTMYGPLSVLANHCPFEMESICIDHHVVVIFPYA